MMVVFHSSIYLQTDEIIQQQYSGKVISVRDVKTIQETSARKTTQTFSTARREWMNSKERKQLLNDSLTTEMLFLFDSLSNIDLKIIDLFTSTGWTTTTP